ncbi:DUF3592 domain-containing protein [Aquabacterium sp.]|uniref:DUF3592 domain-containing protein n=1 Tax=Aquabacterium sp. TaxID=1872578 RepID=UPI002C3E63F7|nr:DUF3592 domain-containing protein [Aquabacterium sp.]HSW05578.1 DUF3592 domain-containing protein [Aquabacterium sp.]
MQQLIIFLIFGGMGFMLLYVGCTQWRLQRRLMRHAVPVPARIVRSEVHSGTPSDSDDSVTHRPELRFRYHCQGRAYESEMLHPTIIVQGHPSHASAEELLAAYPLGASIVAYVDPAHPDKGFLVPQASIGPLVFLLLGALLPPLAWVIGGVL